MPRSPRDPGPTALCPLLTPAGAAALFNRRPISSRHRPAAAARHICFTAALYSDIQERVYHLQWIFAYSDCMLRLYPQIHRFPGLLATLIDRH